MGNIPGPQKERFYEKKYVVELVAVLPPLVTAAVGALVSLADPAKRTLGWWLAGAMAWLALASGVKVLHAAAQDRERKRRKEYDGLRGSLWVLYEAVRGAADLGTLSEGALRITIHRVTDPDRDGAEPGQLEQLLPYIGGLGGPPRRVFSIRAGVIGLAVRDKDAVAVNRKSDGHADFVRELIKEWGYLEDEARAVSPDRQAWMAVPMLSAANIPLAVVSLDSSIPGFFSAEIQKVIVGCCRGLSAYIQEAY
jgi:putative methionine-R-sulfoxide reductase with GAF domain